MQKIYIYKSRMPLPIHFAYHTWLVIEADGKRGRFDVFGFKKDGPWSRTGYLYRHYHNSSYGCPMIAFGSTPFLHEQLQWRADIVHELDSAKYSKIPEVIDLLQNRPAEYPYWNTYQMVPGPNSNTFVQWVLDYVTEGELQLPWGAWGRSYK